MRGLISWSHKLLNWTRHLKIVLCKILGYVGIIYKIKTCVPMEARLHIHNGFNQSRINYCPLLWGFTYKSNIEALFNKQIKEIRAVIPGFINNSYRDVETAGPTKSAFTNYQILKFM